MKTLGLSILLVPYVVFAQSADLASFGVGFSLSLDYGVCSIYFSNGSSVGVAKIEGGSDYKHMMRNQDWTFAGTHTPVNDTPRSGMASMQAILGVGVQGLWDPLPPWLGGPDPDARVEILSRMLQALKTATESYLGSKITDGLVVFPLYVSQSFLNALAAAAKRQSLNLPIMVNTPAGGLAARANRIQTDCDSFYAPPQFFLTMDYSRAALTAVFIKEDCGVFEVQHGIHNTSYGTDSWSNESWDTLVSELRELVQIPADGGDGPYPEHISTVVLLGESAGEKRLTEILREVFLDGNKHYVSITGGSDGQASSKGMIDPLFAPATGLAAQCLWRLNLREYEGLCI